MSNCFYRTILRSILLILIFILGFHMISCDSGDNDSDKISGFVLSGDQPLEGMAVTLLSTGTVDGIRVLGDSETDSTGFFKISFNAPTNPEAILYLTADSNVTGTATSGIEPDSEFVRLATVLRDHPFDVEIVFHSC